MNDSIYTNESNINLVFFFYRNDILAGKGFSAPITRKTGTTIVGCVFRVCQLPYRILMFVFRQAQSILESKAVL